VVDSNRSNFTSQLLADLSFFSDLKILLAGVLGEIAMFVWTSIAQMALPLGEAGIEEIPNESAVLGAIQSSMGDKTSLIFSRTRVARYAAYRRSAG
jgi:hypothetical protein